MRQTPSVGYSVVESAEDVALSARRERNCRPVAPTRDPHLSADRADGRDWNGRRLRSLLLAQQCRRE